MSSVGAVSTAADSRGDKDERCNEPYRIVMPPIPTGEYLLNSVFLHADIGARPYRIEDFQAGLENAGVLKEIAACGSFQMNHVWLVTLKSAAAKEKLAAAKAFEVKGRRCVIIDPDRAEVRLKLHWIPFYMPDDCVKKALEPYGKVEEVSRETWHVGGFEGVQSTTRTVRLTLKENVTVERLPHQLRLSGCSALVLAPGRAPLCLRCRKTGHIRKECRVPRCEGCRRYGHTRSECAKTYADAAHAAHAKVDDDLAEHIMDQDEAEAAAGETGKTDVDLEPRGQAGTAASTSVQPQKPPSKTQAPVVVTPTQEAEGNEPTRPPPPLKPEGKDDDLHRVPLDFAQGAESEKGSVAMEVVASTVKRPLPTADAQDGDQSKGLQQTVQDRWKVVMTKRGRHHGGPPALASATLKTSLDNTRGEASAKESSAL